MWKSDCVEGVYTRYTDCVRVGVEGVYVLTVGMCGGRVKKLQMNIVDSHTPSHY